MSFLCVCACACVRARACVCVCVCESESEQASAEEGGGRREVRGEGVWCSNAITESAQQRRGPVKVA
jgi:hypothetical protein